MKLAFWCIHHEKLTTHCFWKPRSIAFRKCMTLKIRLENFHFIPILNFDTMQSTVWPKYSWFTGQCRYNFHVWEFWWNHVIVAQQKQWLQEFMGGIMFRFVASMWKPIKLKSAKIKSFFLREKKNNKDHNCKTTIQTMALYEQKFKKNIWCLTDHVTQAIHKIKQVKFQSFCFNKLFLYMYFNINYEHFVKFFRYMCFYWSYSFVLLWYVISYRMNHLTKKQNGFCSVVKQRNISFLWGISFILNEQLYQKVLWIKFARNFHNCILTFLWQLAYYSCFIWYITSIVVEPKLDISIKSMFRLSFIITNNYTTHYDDKEKTDGTLIGF